MTAEATVPSEANVEQISSSISTSVNEGNKNNNNKTYQVSFSGKKFFYTFFLNKKKEVCRVYSGTFTFMGDV